MKKRIFFSKFDEMKYISHLDLMRFFERLFKKSSIDIKFSQGFNPRPKMAFGGATPLGIEVYNEPVDVAIEEELSNDKIMKMLNDSSPRGFKVESVIDIESKAAINKDYNTLIFEVEFLKESLLEEFLELLNSKEIILRKEKKDKVKEVELKQKIREYKREGNIVKLYLNEISPSGLLSLLKNKKEEDLKIKKYGYTNI